MRTTSLAVALVLTGAVRLTACGPCAANKENAAQAAYIKLLTSWRLPVAASGVGSRDVVAQQLELEGWSWR
jgi:hypothetical protein